MLAIKTSNLTKIYQGQKAVDALNIHVEAGKVYGFIGKNGAGKTTTIKMLMGLIDASDGSFSILDNAIDPKKVDYKKDIGFVYDVPVFYEWMTAREYMTFCADLYQMDKTKSKQRVLELLVFVKLDKVKKTIGSYSLGMRQRLAIASALVSDPKLLIMDEPTSALDPLGRKEVLDIIRALKGSKTIFYSSHILNDVEKVCDTIGIINEGKLLFEGPLESIRHNGDVGTITLLTKTDSESVAKSIARYYPEGAIRVEGQTLLVVGAPLDSTFDLANYVVNESFGLLTYVTQQTTLEEFFIKTVGGAL